MKRFVLPVLILVIAFGTMRVISSMKKEQKHRKPKQFIRAVAADVVYPKTLNPTIKSMGRVRSREVVDLTPEVSGIVQSQNFRLHKGDSFKRGQVLARIDARQASNSYKTMISDLQNALASLLPELKGDTPQAFDRWNSFFTALTFDNPLPPLPDVENDREKLFVSRFNIYKLYYLARNQRLTLSKYTLKAPFTGTVSTAHVFPASMVRAGVSIATLVRTDNMEIELPLSTSDASLVKSGMAALVNTDALSKPITGKVHRMSKNLDERMQTVSVFVRVNNGSYTELLDGSFATVSITGSPISHAVAVERKAIHDRNKVYLINKGRLVEKEVSVEYCGIETAYVTNGLQKLDTLVIEVLQDAVIGMGIQPVINGKIIGKPEGSGFPDGPPVKKKDKDNASEKSGK